jgi:hypothetical protein
MKLAVLVAIVMLAGASTAAPAARERAPAARPRAAAPVRRARAAPAATPGATRAEAPAGARGPAGPRTLSDIHIEGEIPVPQVLFITARDQRRVLEFQHHRYLRSGAQIGSADSLPAWIVVSAPHTTPAQENSR